MFTHFKRLTRKTSLLTTLISLLAFTIALAASGSPDTTFDGDGPDTADGNGVEPNRRALVYDMAGPLGGNIATPNMIGLAPGDLDSTFGIGGLVTTFVVPSNPARSDLIYDLAVQTDGKIVAIGYSYVSSTSNYDFAVARYNSNGSLDNTFSGDGRLITNFGGRDIAFNVAVQSDGKIVVSGRVCGAPASVGVCDLAVVRYTKNGGLDSTFGVGGKVLTDYHGFSNGTVGGLALQPDGKIVVAGYAYNGAVRRNDFAVYRYLSNGSLDTTFSGDGIATVDFGPGREDFSSVVAIQVTDGKIVVIGNSGDSNFANNDFAVARLKSNGALDPTFSGDGRQTTDMGLDDYPWGFVGLPDGRFVAVGERYNPTTFKDAFAIARYNPDGSLDTTFSGTGKKVFSIAPGVSSFAGDGIVQPDGKIVVTGGSGGDFALVRLKANGAFDMTLSGDGKVTIDFGGSELAWALVRQKSDGKYVLGGYTTAGVGGTDFALARVLP